MNESSCLCALVFSLGNLLYYGFEIAGYLHMSDDCRSQYRFGWTFILRFIFILLQTYFLFKSTGVRTIVRIDIIVKVVFMIVIIIVVSSQL